MASDRARAPPACCCARGRRAQQGGLYAPVPVRLSRSAALAGRLARHHGDGDRAAYHFFSFFRRLLVQLGAMHESTRRDGSLGARADGVHALPPPLAS